MATATTQPNWYPDPSGDHQLRYFDGNRWTDDVMSDGEHSIAPLPQLPASQASGAQVAWGWVIDVLVGWIAGSVALGLTLGIIGAAAGMTDDASRGMEQAGVLIGTVLGIVGMRYLRRRRSES